MDNIYTLDPKLPLQPKTFFVIFHKPTCIIPNSLLIIASKILFKLFTHRKIISNVENSKKT